MALSKIANIGERLRLVFDIMEFAIKEYMPGFFFFLIKSISKSYKFNTVNMYVTHAKLKGYTFNIYLLHQYNLMTVLLQQRDFFRILLLVL